MTKKEIKKLAKSLNFVVSTMMALNMKAIQTVKSDDKEGRCIVHTVAEG